LGFLLSAGVRDVPVHGAMAQKVIDHVLECKHKRKYSVFSFLLVFKFECPKDFGNANSVETFVQFLQYS
jgi:hypothetical protein